ncbi:hypothetical protein AVEN_106842-1 [Araneus ventricosus]|uniref:Uncharacterized protein n=1 Tax=Araneus ventricosus TaxID=182803 RepID=A0A4Y2QFT6_ARAVE|nr:hypothetical protein AVEN_106842-1 [Araneus ventricosus]
MTTWNSAISSLYVSITSSTTRGRRTLLYQSVRQYHFKHSPWPPGTLLYQESCVSITSSTVHDHLELCHIKSVRHYHFKHNPGPAWNSAISESGRLELCYIKSVRHYHFNHNPGPLGTLLYQVCTSPHFNPQPRALGLYIKSVRHYHFKHNPGPLGTLPYQVWPVGITLSTTGVLGTLLYRICTSISLQQSMTARNSAISSLYVTITSSTTQGRLELCHIKSVRHYHFNHNPGPLESAISSVYVTITSTTTQGAWALLYQVCTSLSLQAQPRAAWNSAISRICTSVSL